MKQLEPNWPGIAAWAAFALSFIALIVAAVR